MEIPILGDFSYEVLQNCLFPKVHQVLAFYLPKLHKELVHELC